MVRTVTRKTPSAATTWYRIGKSANTGIKRSSSSRRKELVKLKSMKKVTKRVLEEKLKRAYLRDGEEEEEEEEYDSPEIQRQIREYRPVRLIRRNGRIEVVNSSSPSPRRQSPRRPSPISYSSSASSVGEEYPECSVCYENTSKGTLCDIGRNIYHPICRKCFNKVKYEGDRKCPVCRKDIISLLNLPRDGSSFKACPPGQTRSRKGHCVKIWSRSPRRKSLNPGYELNRKTGRLRKVCPSGKKRSRKGRCKKI